MWIIGAIAVWCVLIAIILVFIHGAKVLRDEEAAQPRCSATGQPLTLQQQYDQECG